MFEWREIAGKAEIGIAKHQQKLCTDKWSNIQVQLFCFHTSCMHVRAILSVSPRYECGLATWGVAKDVAMDLGKISVKT